MMTLNYIFAFLIFPGFLFSLTMGLLVGWVDRKVTARVQWRKGPPWYQNFADVAKLIFYKETLVPEGASKIMFLGMPLVALSAAALISTIILKINMAPATTFIGDLIVVVYLLIIPSLAIILGGFSSANAYASLGASREMKLMLAYELPFILSLVVPVMKSGYAIRLGDIINHQAAAGPVIGSASGVISFIVILLCVQAKLGFVPFDMAEAETEIIGGTCIEYSGKALAIFKMAKAILGFILPVLILTLYFGGISFSFVGFIKSVLWYILILVLLIVIKNTNPRVRIDQAIRFFWVPMMKIYKEWKFYWILSPMGLVIIAIVLAYLGY